MVYENKIPFEINKKPFETVYELKNEAPSFEEFMRTYKADDNLNYDDLSGGSVGESEGYGPCRRYNSYCNCDSDERWADLVVACPAKGCMSTDETPRNWTRKKCGHRVEISNKARIQCTNYGGCHHAQHVAYWLFKCSWHKGEDDYWEVGERLFINAVLMANDLKKIDRQVAIELVNYLTSHEWPKK